MLLCGTNDEQPNIEDRATQPMDAGGWVLQLWSLDACHIIMKSR